MIMKTRESGMPEDTMWETFFDPATIFDRLDLDQNCRTVVDFGCGYGTFSIPAAKRIKGIVYALDIDPDMIGKCKVRANAEGLHNIVFQQRDFVELGTGLSDGSIDYVMMFNLLHAEETDELLKEAKRILMPNGKIAVIHWNYDIATPRGPSMEIRPKPEQLQQKLRSAGFHLLKPLVELPPYHYGMLGLRPAI